MSSLCDLVKVLGLRADEICAVPSGGGGLRMHQLEVDPYDFLLQAEEDWELGGDSSELNAITNAKRAIVCQMDQALMSFGYPATKWNIPKKIEAMTELGLVAPRILRRVASARNLLEHEYRRPGKSEIEDSLDLAALFIAAVKPIISVFCDEFLVGNQSERIDHFSFQRELTFSMSTAGEGPPVFSVCAHAVLGDTRKRVGETIISWKDIEFPIIVRLALATDRDFKLDAALNDFCVLVSLT